MGTESSLFHMEDITKDNRFIEFDKKTGIGDLLFVRIEQDIMHYRFCRIRDNVKECLLLEFDDRDNNQCQISFFQEDKCKREISNCQQWALYTPSDGWKLLSLNQPPFKLVKLLKKMNF